MGQISAFFKPLDTGNWIAIVFGVIGAIGVCAGVANYLAGRRERKLKTYETAPDVQATINRKLYEGGWRSVQLHIVEPSEAANFKLTNWYIERTCLLRPWWRAKLARAENDDYATGVFYPDKPVRCLWKERGPTATVCLGVFSQVQRER